MKKFVYYKIEGFLPSSFISNRLGSELRFASREKAVSVLEKVINEWKEQEGFKAKGELVCECIDEVLGYRHQFAWKNRRGMIYEITYKVVEHKVFYVDE